MRDVLGFVHAVPIVINAATDLLGSLGFILAVAKTGEYLNDQCVDLVSQILEVKSQPLEFACVVFRSAFPQE